MSLISQYFSLSLLCTVLVLLSALLVQGRGCDEILQESIKHQLIFIDEKGPDAFVSSFR